MDIRDGTLTVRVIPDANVQTLSLAGELDMANAPSLASAIGRAEEEGAESIVVDLSELEFIDSTGIAILVSAHRRLNDGAERVVLVRSRSLAVRRVMEVTGLERELPFVDRDESVAEPAG